MLDLFTKNSQVNVKVVRGVENDGEGKHLRYTASLTKTNPKVLTFDGTGSTMCEAVGDCLISNREILGLTLELHNGSECSYCLKGRGFYGFSPMDYIPNPNSRSAFAKLVKNPPDWTITVVCRTEDCGRV